MKPFQLNEDYRISCDGRSWVLEERYRLKDKDTGGWEFHWRGGGWFTSFESLARTATIKLVHDSDEDLLSALAEAKDIFREIGDRFAKLGLI